MVHTFLWKKKTINKLCLYKYFKKYLVKKMIILYLEKHIMENITFVCGNQHAISPTRSTFFLFVNFSCTQGIKALYNINTYKYHIQN